MSAFRTEQQLFHVALNSQFINRIKASFTFSTSFIELRGLFGRPDLVIAGTDSINHRHNLQTYAFEMKLSNWSQALVQAFRYRAFATISYVLLDRAFVMRALRNIQRFEKANVGLLSIDHSGEIIIHHEPEQKAPYSARLELTFHEIIYEQGLTIHL